MSYWLSTVFLMIKELLPENIPLGLIVMFPMEAKKI